VRSQKRGVIVQRVVCVRIIYQTKKILVHLSANTREHVPHAMIWGISSIFSRHKRDSHDTAAERHDEPFEGRCSAGDYFFL
jgi:hypothetical protein